MKRVWLALGTLVIAGGTVGGVVVATRDKPASEGDGNVGRLLTETELKYALIDRFGPLHYCDPDSFPVSSGDEESKAKAWWGSTDKTGEEVTAIRRRLGLVGGNLTDPSILRIYQDHKRLQAVPLEADGGSFRFDVRTTLAGKGDEIASKGTIKADGRIRIEDQKREPGFGCLICLEALTLIDTPDGPIRVVELEEGMRVWTVDLLGRRIVGMVSATTRRAVASGHPMIRLTLEDGRIVSASPGHPTVDGRSFASLVIGEIVDGARITSIDVEASATRFTYDLLPSGPTGGYWADGVLIGSTLALHLPA